MNPPSPCLPAGQPTAPAFAPPPGACDCHAHVIGPFERYPLAEARPYDPPAAPLASLESMLATMGLERVVIAHVSAHGMDLSVTLDALRALGPRAMGVTVLGDSLPHVEAGRLRVIAVTSPERSPFLPEAPTFSDLGAPQIVARETFGLYLPAGAAPETVQRLAEAVQASLDSDEVKAGLTKLACVPTYLSSEAFRQFLERDLAHWEPVVKTSGFSLDD